VYRYVYVVRGSIDAVVQSHPSPCSGCTRELFSCCAGERNAPPPNSLSSLDARYGKSPSNQTPCRDHPPRSTNPQMSLSFVGERIGKLQNISEAAVKLYACTFGRRKPLRRVRVYDQKKNKPQRIGYRPWWSSITEEETHRWPAPL